jgi:riboflavin kinase/FMN adenylyltransferase
VIGGDQLGRKLGFHTANIHIAESYKLIPKDGIYATDIVHQGKTYQGMLYIGRRPTIEGTSRNVEVNIFDFNKDIYTDLIEVRLLSFVREDKKLNSLEDLKQQLRQDEYAVRNYFSSYLKF